MSVQAIGALTRASWHQAKSYRMSLIMQVGGLLFNVVPVFFIANALQSTMAGTIAAESEQYFAFILVGMVATMFMAAGLTTLMSAISGGISNGYFESLLVTRTPVTSILLGLTSYGVIHTIVRAAVMLFAGSLLGAQVSWSQIGPALLLIALILAVYWGLGLIASASIIAFRTAGPFINMVTAISILFGGVYYPVTVIPSWLRSIADLTPMAYGLRALRRVLLLGDGIGSVGSDLAMLAAMSIVSLLLGSVAMAAALRYAKKSGALSTY